MGKNEVGVEEKKREEIKGEVTIEDFEAKSRAVENNEDSIALYCLEQ